MKLFYPLDWKKQDEFSITRQRSAQTHDGYLIPHWYSCFEILYLLEGCRDFFAGEEIFTITAGDILVIPPHLSHGSSGGVYDSIVFGYAESVIYTPYNSCTGLKYVLPFRGAGAQLLRGETGSLHRLRELLVRGRELYAGDSPGRMLEIRACILQVHGILWQLYLDSARNDAGNIRYLSEAQEFIEAHLTEDISPYDIADALHISHSHLCRIIKSALHVTPATLINRFRLCLAESLLTELPELSVTEVALRSGFRDSSYFIRVFHADKGMTPGQFRQFVEQARGIV